MGEEKTNHDELESTESSPSPPSEDDMRILERGAKPAPEPPAPKEQAPTESSPGDVDKMRPQKSE